MYTLVLENLIDAGFRRKPISSGLDINECLSVLGTLARFHALSSHVDAEWVELLDDATRADWGSHPLAAPFAKFFAKFEDYLMRPDSPILSASARKAIEKFKNDGGYASAIELGYSFNERGLNVILHGDAHRFNILFRPREGRTQIKLVDFQHCRLGSPVLDIMTFLIVSCPADVFDNHRTLLLDHYLRVFAYTTSQYVNRDLFIKPSYTWDDLETDMIYFKPFFMYLLIIARPLIWAGKFITCHRSDSEQNDIFDSILQSTNFHSYFSGWIKYFE
jgi:hypothetical protein